jgi:hypothetical protein
VTAAAELLATLQARGVTLEPRGDKLRLRPADRLSPEDLDRLRALKPAILALLAPPPAPSSALDPATLREVLGRDADNPHAVAYLRFDVLAVVRRLEQEIESGEITPGVRLVRGRPLADWLSLDDLAALLRAWGERTRRRRL